MPIDPRDHFVRIVEIVERTGLKKSALYRLIQEGKFPKGVLLSANSRGWLNSEVQAWMDARLAADPDYQPWTPPAPPPRKVPEEKLPPLAAPGHAGEVAARIAGVVGIAASPDETVPDAEIALRFPDWPEMMRRRTAAAYLDLTESAFIREVGRGRLPFPVLLGNRESWSRQAIDRAIAKLLSS